LKKRIITALILLVSVMMIAAAAFSPAVSAEGERYPSYDYTHHGSGSNVTLGASDVTAGYLQSLGEQLCEKEREFLDSFGKLTLTYSTLVPQQNVNFEFDSGILTVTAKDYSYVADGGVFVRNAKGAS
jgi:hypothetical protein